MLSVYFFTAVCVSVVGSGMLCTRHQQTLQNYYTRTIYKYVFYEMTLSLCWVNLDFQNVGSLIGSLSTIGEGFCFSAACVEYLVMMIRLLVKTKGGWEMYEWSSPRSLWPFATDRHQKTLRTDPHNTVMKKAPKIFDLPPIDGHHIHRTDKYFSENGCNARASFLAEISGF